VFENEVVEFLELERDVHSYLHLEFSVIEIRRKRGHLKRLRAVT
jgi:hypothetical protein